MAATVVSPRWTWDSPPGLQTATRQHEHRHMALLRRSAQAGHAHLPEDHAQAVDVDLLGAALVEQHLGGGLQGRPLSTRSQETASSSDTHASAWSQACTLRACRLQSCGELQTCTRCVSVLGQRHARAAHRTAAAAGASLQAGPALGDVAEARTHPGKGASGCVARGQVALRGDPGHAHVTYLGSAILHSPGVGSALHSNSWDMLTAAPAS